MLTSVGIHAWVIDPPHLQGKNGIMSVFGEQNILMSPYTYIKGKAVPLHAMEALEGRGV
jgi:hypothetical protein